MDYLVALNEVHSTISSAGSPVDYLVTISKGHNTVSKIQDSWKVTIYIGAIHSISSDYSQLITVTCARVPSFQISNDTVACYIFTIIKIISDHFLPENCVKEEM